MSSAVATAVPLCRENLDEISKTTSVPNYLDKDLSAGILHFGVGNFHRSHQARYIHNLLQKGLALDWCIVGAGVLPVEIPSYEKLTKQDCLYTLVEKSPDNTSTSAVVGSIIDFIKPTEAQAVLDKLADPKIRIITLTITKGGYLLSPKTGEFDPTHPAVKEDANRFTRGKGELPKTVFGLLVNALKARRENGTTPFTVLSCDNMPENGEMTRRALVGLAGMCDSDLSNWITDNVSFPCCMVDRITPATGDHQRSIVRKLCNIEDVTPVVSESHQQWIVEDKFPAGRPPLEKVGVKFVDDVSSFERMKMRILNGAHASLVHASGLLGLEFVHNALGDSDIRDFLIKVEREEIVPIVGDVSGVDLNEYLDTTINRLGNPTVCDRIDRLCGDGSNRQTKYIIPSALDNVNAGNNPEGLALVSAFWCRYYYGEIESGEKVTPVDSMWEHLNELSKRAKDEPAVWLSEKKLYGELADSKPFVESFSKWLEIIWSDGTRKALRTFVEQYSC